MDPVYKSHPLFKLRRILLLNALMSFIFGAVSLSTTDYNATTWTFHIVFTVLSAFVCLFDLIRWVSKKAGDPEHEPKWPLKFVMICDALLAGLFLWIALCELFSYEGYYTPPSGSFARAYACLCAITAGILHGRCFWKQVMAIKEREWKAKLPTSRNDCNNCGAPTEENAATTDLLGTQTSQNPNPTDNVASTASARGFFGQVFPSRSTTLDPDIEAIIASTVPSSSNRSACLITPNTDDEDDEFSDSLILGKSGEYGTMKSPSEVVEPAIEYSHEDVAVVKKKKASRQARISKGKDRSKVAEQS